MIIIIILKYTYASINIHSFEINIENLASFSITVLFEEQNSCSNVKSFGRI